jgi:hypothetical protein
MKKKNSLAQNKSALFSLLPQRGKRDIWLAAYRITNDIFIVLAHACAVIAHWLSYYDIGERPKIRYSILGTDKFPDRIHVFWDVMMCHWVFPEVSMELSSTWNT